jgi:hypothetical protein
MVVLRTRENEIVGYQRFGGIAVVGEVASKHSRTTSGLVILSFSIRWVYVCMC